MGYPSGITSTGGEDRIFWLSFWLIFLLQNDILDIWYFIINLKLYVSTLLTHQAVSEAAKILRLLYINDLRKLQTQINEAIVSVQTVTANPKTDTRLGKVGR